MMMSRFALFGFGALTMTLAFGHSPSALAAADCPTWSQPVCRHWNLGPPASCTEWACAATKGSDPPKSVQGTIGGGKNNRFPIVTTSGLQMQNMSSANPSAPMHTKSCVGMKLCH